MANAEKATTGDQVEDGQSPELVRIEDSILLVRGQKVMLDADLATLYGVETRILIQAVRRNPKRFPVVGHFEESKYVGD